MGTEGRVRAALAGLIFVTATAVFMPAVSNDFVLDDVNLIVRNTTLERPVSPARIFSSHYWAPEPAQGLYRPVVILSFAAQRAVWGINPVPYRVLNVILHGAVSVLFFLVALRIVTSTGTAFAAALLYAVHPVQTEAVINAVGRADILAALCSFGCVLLYFNYFGREGKRGVPPALLAGVVFLLGLLSKENAAAAPLLIIAFHFMQPRGSRRTRRLFGFLAVLAVAFGIWLVLRWNALGSELVPGAQASFVSNPIAHFGLPLNLAASLRVLGHAFLILLFPVHLTADYSYNQIPLPVGLFHPAVLAATAVTVGWWLAGLCLKKRQPAILMAALLFYLPWLPVSNWPVPIGTVFAERLLYLPSAGFCIMAGMLLYRLPASRGRYGKAVAAGLLGIAATLFVVRIERRIPDFRHELVFHERLVETSPRSFTAHFHLATIYQSRGLDQKAIEAYRRALEVYDEDTESAYRLGMLLIKAQQPGEAVGYLLPLTTKHPDSAKLNGLLGMAFQGTGRTEEAAKYLEWALRAEPENAQIVVMLAELKLVDEPESAAALAVQATALAPEDPVVQGRAGMVLMRAGRLERAEKALSTAVALWPGGGGPVKSLSSVLVRLGRADEAVGLIEMALRENPGDPDLRNNLAWALSSIGSPEALERAKAEAGRALEIAPESPDILDTAAEVYFKLGDRSKALSYATQALEHAPPDRKAHFESRLDHYRTAR